MIKDVANYNITIIIRCVPLMVIYPLCTRITLLCSETYTY